LFLVYIWVLAILSSCIYTKVA